MTRSSTNNQVGPGSRLSFGVMCSGNTLQEWQAECVRLLLSAGHTCKLLIVDANETREKSISDKIGGYLCATGLYNFNQRFFFRPKARIPVSINSVITLIKEGTSFPTGRRAGDGVMIETIYCRTSKKKYSEYFSAEDIEIIKSHKLDFILRFGFNIIRGEILAAAKFGVWSFHHDDEQKYRGGPPGFWEIVTKDPVTGVILQRLTDKLDGGIILKKGFYNTIDHSYSGQINHLYFASAEWPLQVCNDIVNADTDVATKIESQTKAKIFKTPANLQMLNFWRMIVVNKLRFHYQELFRAEDWNIGISETGIDLFTKRFGNNKLLWPPQPPKGRYFADPFGFITGDELNIVFEDYDYKSRKGSISKITFTNGKFEEVKPLIVEDFHLSYPYILQIGNEIYCLPESADAGQVRLYIFKNISGRFHFEKLLLDGFPGVDPTCFKYKGKWWLFATHKEESNTSLYAFFSDNFDGPYFQHRNNPIKVDVQSARPAGNPYFENGELIRPAQDCSQTYGGRIALNKIVRLTETEFQEETVKFTGPFKSSSYRDGFHTLAVAGNYTIFDGKRFRFNRNNFWHKLKIKLGIG